MKFQKNEIIKICSKRSKKFIKMSFKQSKIIKMLCFLFKNIQFKHFFQQFQARAIDRSPQLTKAANDLRRVGNDLTQMGVVVFNGRRGMKSALKHVNKK